MAPIEKIDYILKLFAEDETIRPLATDGEILTRYLQECPDAGKPFEGSEIKSILEQLLYDKYIRPVEVEIWPANFNQHDTVTKYAITFSGGLFHQRGGYQNELMERDAENIRVGNLEKHQKAYESNMTYLTATLASFAFLSVLIQSLDKFHVVFEIQFWTAFFLFCAGILVGLCICLLVLEVKNHKHSR